VIKVGFKVGSGDEVSAKILHRLLANRLADATNNKTNKNPKVMQSEPISHDIDSASSDLRWRDIEALFSTISGKIIKNDEETMLIISGFPYAKNQIGDYRIEIIQVKKGIFTASQNSAVPTLLLGTLYGIAGGSFVSQCTAAEGTETFVDAVGCSWIFSDTNCCFPVHLRGNKQPSYYVKPAHPGAEIFFLKKGVKLVGMHILKANCQPDEKQEIKPMIAPVAETPTSIKNGPYREISIYSADTNTAREAIHKTYGDDTYMENYINDQFSLAIKKAGPNNKYNIITQNTPQGLSLKISSISIAP